MAVSSLLTLSTTDLYYICQVIDRVVHDPTNYVRRIEDILGDASSAILTRPYQKYTPLHLFIEGVIDSIADEDSAGSKQKPWLAYLLESNGYKFAYSAWVASSDRETDYFDFVQYLIDEDVYHGLLEKLAHQVFFVLFQNRRTLGKFGILCADYVLNASPAFSPEAFSIRGRLIRRSPPSWAKRAVYHRDKGRCVICRRDLTGIINQVGQIHYDHIVPLNLGGMNDVTNLQVICSTCNLRKGGSTATSSNDYEPWYDV